MIIKPIIRRNICINAHPLGCAAQVRAQIDYVMNREKIVGPKKVLVIGASNGFGMPGVDYSQDVRPDLF